ncbi:hypothetical protein KI387_037397, partial [Taxus chinensis]
MEEGLIEVDPQNCAAQASIFCKNRFHEALTEEFRAEMISMGRDRSGQGLSLSLSSHHPSLQQFEAMASHRANVLQVFAATEAKAKSEELFNRQGTNGNPGLGTGYVSSYSREENIPRKGYVGGGSTMELHMNVGPSGPFAGYAT